jgi:hypothetical protein
MITTAVCPVTGSDKVAAKRLGLVQGQVHNPVNLTVLLLVFKLNLPSLPFKLGAQDRISEYIVRI